MTLPKSVCLRLAFLKKELEAERISYGELAELRALVEAHRTDIEDIRLLEAAGVPENL